VEFSKRMEVTLTDIDANGTPGADTSWGGMDSTAERAHRLWDEQIERDAAAGKLDKLIAEAKAERDHTSIEALNT
jgi:hypothetical protein